ncbi:MAG: mechanosensitive ion channel family protein [Pseudomonadota bacterium]
MANIFKLLILFAALSLATPVVSQETASETIQSDIAPTETKPTDAQIQSEINRIFGEIESLGRVDASVNAGVVTLSGITATADATARAENIAARVNGVVTVENEIERDVSVDSRLTPALEETRNYIADAIKFTPLFALALAVFALIAFVGWLLSGWRSLWRRATPNAFIAEIAATSIRLVFIVLAAIAALSLLDATALLGAFLGAAGVLGLAVGFAVRDTIENYIASIMLSLRQPFRPNDHVRIDDKEGRVIRLTSRATVLMTLDGNHLRIPNAAVFKAVILNYSRNEDRRFQFDLGVDADDDPLAAIDTGLDTIRALAFVLKEPAPAAFIKDVGDSNIVITFTAWIDQSQSDFMKSRSVALAAAKDALEEAGFALPEPIYRLRFDAASPPILKEAASATVSETSTASVAAQKKDLSAKSKRARADQALDTRPDTHIADKVEEERLETGEADLLDDDAPVE